MIYSSMLEASLLPRLIYPCPRDCPNLVAVVFEFMKRIPAQFCVERALNPGTRQILGKGGLFVPDQRPQGTSALVIGSERNGEKRLFIETSSGNMATGLAEVCKEQGIPLYLLLPSEVDDGTRHSLQELGAMTEIIDTFDQTVRVKRLGEVKRKYEEEGWNVWWVEQYNNPNNRTAYWRLAEFLALELDSIDQLVAPVGTGGSSGGTSWYLRQAGFPAMKLVGVDACGSVNFDHAPSDFLMGGIGSTRLMPLVDPKTYDTVHWLDDETAFAASIELFDAGIPVGASSGAAFVAARYEAKKAPHDEIVVIFPDHGRRYASTVRSEEWRKQNNVHLQRARTEPVQVSHPDESDPSKPGVQPAWYRLDWRSYQSAKPAAPQ